MPGNKSYDDLINEAMAKIFTKLPDQVVVVEGHVEAPPAPRSIPFTRPTLPYLREVGDWFIEVHAGSKGAELIELNRAVHSLSQLRVGINQTEGLGISLPLNAKQLPAASRALGESCLAYGQVGALVDPADSTEIPALLGEIQVRQKLCDEAKENLDVLQRGLTASYHRLDVRVRKYLTVLMPLANYSGVGVALRPFFALTQDPADKAQATLQDRQKARQQGREEGRVEGREEALAETRKAAKKAGTQLNVGVVTPPEEPEEPAPVDPTRGRGRQSPR